MGRPLGLTIAAGVAVFLVVLAVYLPASWFAGALPPQVRCGNIGGSLWHGECLGLELAGSALGDATWNIAMARALTGRLAGDIDVRGGPLTARAEIDTDFSGNGELRNVSVRFPMDPAFVAQFPRDQRGLINAALEKIVVTEGRILRQVKGTVTLQDFRQVGPHPSALGSYEVAFDGVPGDEPAGKLRDLGGPFAVEGIVTLRAQGYLVEGFITGRSADAERIVRQITLGARPDASGRSAFRFEVER